MKSAFYLFIYLLIGMPVFSQENTTPVNAYQWKRNKTIAEPGYVVLKSGKRLEGKIALSGTPNNVVEVVFEDGDKSFELPVASLQSFGLLRQVNSKAYAGPINESPESMYEWKYVGVVMDKEVYNSVPRDGYVVLKSGERYEGVLKLKKVGGVIKSYQIKGESKQKGDYSDIAKYGYQMSASELEQNQLSKLADVFYNGTITTPAGELHAQIAQVNLPGHFYSKKILVKNQNGDLTEYDANQVLSFTQNIDGENILFIPYKNTFVEEEFKGQTFHVFRNPFPTTINTFLTNTVKGTIEVGTNVAAQAIVNRDAKDNNYETNMDSIIANSSTEQLIEMRSGLVTMGGYSSVEELNEFSDNESLKNNVAALDLAISGKEVHQVEGGILNKEWVILNIKTGEELMIYKSDYKKLMEPLLKGCYEYLSMEKSKQREMENWKNLISTVKILDNCY